jgi:hypothetical protein
MQPPATKASPMRLPWVIALQLLRAGLVYLLVMSILIISNVLTGYTSGDAFTVLLALIVIAASYAGARFLRRRFPAAFPRIPRVTTALRGTGVAITWLGWLLCFAAGFRSLIELAEMSAAPDTLTVLGVLDALRNVGAAIVILISGIALRNANAPPSSSLEVPVPPVVTEAAPPR